MKDDTAGVLTDLLAALVPCGNGIPPRMAALVW